MLVCCLGDVMLDVIVDAPTGIVADDDTTARITLAPGGQAANVAAWVATLGGESRVFGPHAESGAGRLVGDELSGAGVEMHGPTTAQPGVVMSLLTPGTRSLASDPGSLDWLTEIAPGPWLEGADWLFVSGYALLRSPQPQQIIDLAATARSAGTSVAVDLSSAAMITQYGAAAFHRLWRALRPSVIFANDDEWAATNAGDGVDTDDSAGASGVAAGGGAVLVLKHGSRGATFVIDGIADHRPPEPAQIVDVTGSGDALSAGYLVGGVELAMTAAARCASHTGAQPPRALRAESEGSE